MSIWFNSSSYCYYLAEYVTFSLAVLLEEMEREAEGSGARVNLVSYLHIKRHKCRD